MKATILLFMTALLMLSATGSAIEVEGDVWGVWTPDNNPYLVVGEVRVPPESTLTIEPGVLVNFQGHFKFIVDNSATLIAAGTRRDSIVFTTDDASTGWHGIRFLHSSANSRISYCRIEYGKATGEPPDSCGGGIFCQASEITISHSYLAANSAEGDGAAIYCDSCVALSITDNVIVGNSAETGHGGGIFCERCENLSIIGNTISDNYAHRGGGMNCVRDSIVVVSGNTISGNSSFNSGAGIRLQKISEGLITQNLVSGNWTLNEPGGNGAGIYTRNCGRDVIVSGNIVTENVAAGRGGGFFCRNARTTLINNSAAGNSAAFGGGIACREYAHPLLVNSVLWSDSASRGPEICLLNMDSDPCTLTIAYCDVDGGQSGVRVDPGCVLHRGQGNFAEDPIFVDLDRYDLNLRWHSPCIDAGVPDSLDPDGTPSDIGAVYFNQDVTDIVELYPYNTPIVIPAEGGQLVFDAWIFNFSGQSHRTDIWTYLFVPNGQHYGPLELHENVRIRPDSLGQNQMTQNIPRAAPEGEYVFVAYVGDYPDAITDSSYFYFAKSDSQTGLSTDWSEPVSGFALSQNYPNPFNATTTIYYQVPVHGQVKLEVYNLLGRKVATLVDSKQQPGYKSTVWDASELSSGLYFYKLTAGDFTDTRRMMLVK